MKKNYLKHEFRTALLLTIGQIAVFFWVGAFHYEMNDDMAIMALLKGLFGMTPSGEGVFITPLLGWGLFLLYNWLPLVPWFSLFLYGGLSLACFLSNLTILTLMDTLWTKTAGLIGVAFFIWLTASQISFTAVSLQLWVTGCIFLIHSTLHSKVSRLWSWLASFSLAAAYLLRPSLLPLLLLFALPLLLTLLLSGRRANAMRALAPLIAVIFLCIIGSFVTRTDNVYEKYHEFNNTRSEFTDTYRSNPSTNTQRALFNAEWSENDYIVSKNWWLHDSDFFNAEQIKTFLAANAKTSDVFNYGDFKRFLLKNKTFMGIIFLWVFVVSCSEKITLSQKNKPLIIAGYLFLFSSVLLLMGIRFPQRIGHPCFLMLFLYPALLRYPHQENNRPFLLKFTPSALFIIFLIFTFIPIVKSKTQHLNLLREKKQYIDQTLFSVLRVHGQNSIIVDLNPTKIDTIIFPFQENDAVLKTRVLPGGWLVGSPAYLDFLKREGLGDRSTVVPSMVDNRRVVLRFWDSAGLTYRGYVENIFLKHLRQRYQVIGSDRHIELKILGDFRQGTNYGLIYFQLVTGATH